MKKSLILAGAFFPEIDIAAKMNGRPLPEFPDITLETLELGIGGSSAILCLQERLLKIDRPVQEIVYIGSAGLYSGKNGVPDPIGLFSWSRSFFNQEISVIEGRGRIPDQMRSAVESRPGRIAQLIRDRLNCPEALTNSADSITLSRVIWPPAGLLPGLENMEAFGCALTTEKYGADFAAFYAVTNMVGPDGSDEWRKNYLSLSQKLQIAVMEALGFKPDS